MSTSKRRAIINALMSLDKECSKWGASLQGMNSDLRKLSDDELTAKVSNMFLHAKYLADLLVEEDINRPKEAHLGIRKGIKKLIRAVNKPE